MNLDYALGKTLMELEEMCKIHRFTLPDGYKKRFQDNQKQLESEFQKLTQTNHNPVFDNTSENDFSGI